MELVLVVFTRVQPDIYEFEIIRKIQQPVWIPNSVYYTDEFPSWR